MFEFGVDCIELLDGIVNTCGDPIENRVAYRVRNSACDLLDLEEERELIVRLRQLRDPGRLAGLAKELGFVHPETVVMVADVDLAEAGETGDTLALARSATEAHSEPLRTASAEQSADTRATR